MEEIKEAALNGLPGVIPFDCTQKIIEQMRKDICKIKSGEEQGTGFFCKIPFPNMDNMLPVLITNNHVINEDVLYKENSKILLRIKDEQKEKEIYLNKRIKYTNQNFDITIIEIKDKDEIKNYLELDDKIINDIINNENENYEYVDETLYIIHYPEGKLSVSYGILQNIFVDRKFNFSHKCSTRRGSSGSPILNLKNKIIGIHKEGTNKYNKGTFLNYPIKEFIEQNCFNKENKIENNLIIDKNLYSDFSEFLKNICKLRHDMLYPDANKINWGSGGKRGGFEYKPPYGWIGVGLNVLGKYDNGNNDWLGNNGNKDEWAIAYHAIGKNKNDLNEVVLDNYDDIFHPGQKVGKGIYLTPSPKGMELVGKYNIFDINEKKYMVGMMVRVKPCKIRCPSLCDKTIDYWILNGTSLEIRPYRILFKEINEKEKY